MTLTHLQPLLPSFMHELDKLAGIKNELKAGTKKVVTALKSVPEKAHNASLKAALHIQRLPGGTKAIQMATDPNNAPDIATGLGKLFGA